MPEKAKSVARPRPQQAPPVKPDQWWGGAVARRQPVAPTPLPSAPPSVVTGNRLPTPAGFSSPSPSLVRAFDAKANSPKYTPQAQQLIGSVPLTNTTEQGAWGTAYPQLGGTTVIGVSPMIPSSGYWNNVVINHEINHAVDWQKGVTLFGSGQRNPYGQIVPSIAQSLSAQTDTPLPLFREFPYLAMARTTGMGNRPNDPYFTEQYAYAGQTPSEIPAPLRMFYPQYTPAAYAPERAGRYVKVVFEDGSWGWMLDEYYAQLYNRTR